MKTVWYMVGGTASDVAQMNALFDGVLFIDISSLTSL